MGNLAESNSDLRALSSEVDKQLYSRSRFGFKNTGGWEKPQVHGYETVKEFFYCIGPLKLSNVTHINCEFACLPQKSGIETIFHPPRDLKNLYLILEEVQDAVLAGQKS